MRIMKMRNTSGVCMSMSMVKWVCVMLVLVKCVCADYRDDHPEKDALIAFKNNINDPTGVLNNWDPNEADPCTFDLVRCEDGIHVTEINIQNNNLSGNIVPDLQKLAYLQYLVLFKNNFQGSIPPELGNLENLIGLDLYNNNLSGTIPAELGKLKSLVSMRMDDNHLTGPIPTELTNIASLRLVELYNNDLCGTVPSFQKVVQLNVTNNPRLKGGQSLGISGNDASC